MSVSAFSMATEPQGTETTAAVAVTSGAGEVPVEFRAPLWGFANQTTYLLRPAVRTGIWWLQSAGADATTFVLADPFVVDDGYVVDLGDKERASLGLTAPDDALALVMLTLPSAAGGTVTANFRAPIVINIRTHAALQVVSRDDAHELQRVINLAAYPLPDEAVAASAGTTDAEG